MNVGVVVVSLLFVSGVAATEITEATKEKRQRTIQRPLCQARVFAGLRDKSDKSVKLGVCEHAVLWYD